MNNTSNLELALEEYFSSKCSLRSLASKHGVALTTLSKKAKADPRSNELDNSPVPSVASYKAHSEPEQLSELNTTERIKQTALTIHNHLDCKLGLQQGKTSLSTNDLKNIATTVKELQLIYTVSGLDPVETEMASILSMLTPIETVSIDKDMDTA